MAIAGKLPPSPGCERAWRRTKSVCPHSGLRGYTTDDIHRSFVDTAARARRLAHLLPAMETIHGKVLPAILLRSNIEQVRHWHGRLLRGAVLDRAAHRTPGRTHVVRAPAVCALERGQETKRSSTIRRAGLVVSVRCFVLFVGIGGCLCSRAGEDSGQWLTIVVHFLPFGLLDEPSRDVDHLA